MIEANILLKIVILGKWPNKKREKEDNIGVTPLSKMVKSHLITNWERWFFFFLLQAA